MICDGWNREGNGCETEATFRVGPIEAMTVKMSKASCSSHLIQIIRYFMQFNSPIDIRIWQRQ